MNSQAYGNPVDLFRYLDLQGIHPEVAITLRVLRDLAEDGDWERFHAHCLALARFGRLRELEGRTDEAAVVKQG